MKKIFQKDAFFVFIILLLGILSITWFRGQFLVNPGDTNFSFNPKNDLYRSLFVWDHQQELGRLDSMAAAKIFPYNLLLSVFTYLGFSIYLSQKILFYLIFTTSGLTAYFLIKYFLSSRSYFRISALLGANFYMINTYLIQLRWGSGYLMGLFFYALFPFLVLMWFQGRETKKIKFSIYLALGVFFALPSLNNPAYITPFLVICVLDLLTQFFINIRNKNELISLLKFVFSTASIFILVLSFWLILIGITINDSLSILNESTLQFKQEIVSASASSLLNLFRNLGDWGFWGEYKGDLNYYYSSIYSLLPFIVIGYIILFFSLFPLFFLKKQNIKQRFSIIFFSLVFLIGTWLSKGIHIPFGSIYSWLLQNIPLFLSLRSAYEKFGPVICLSVSVLITFSLAIFLQNVKKRSVQVVLLLLLFFFVNFYAWPFWTGDVWREQTKLLPGFRFKIPGDYYDLQTFLDQQQADFRIFNLPDNATLVPGIITLNLEGKLYGGSDPLSRLLSVPIFYLNAFDFDVFGGLISNFYSLYLQNPKEFISLFRKYSGLLNTRYIFLRGESDNSIYTNIKSPDFIKPFLDSDFSLVRKLGTISVYEVDDKYFLPHFYIPQNIIYSPNDVDTLPEIVGLPGYELRSAIYLEPEIDRNTIEINRNKVETDRNSLKYAASPRNRGILERADEIFVKGERKDIGYWISDISKKESLKNGMPVPYVRWEPGSLEWKLARIQEQFDEWKVRKEPEKLFDKKLFYAGKRIAEIEKYAPQSGAKYDGNIVEIYKNKMEEAIEIVGNMSRRPSGRNTIETNRNQEINKNILKLKAYLERHKEKIEEIYGNTTEINRNWEEVFEELEGKIAELEPKKDFGKLAYQFEIPKKGKYEIYVKDMNIRNISRLDVGTKYAASPQNMVAEDDRNTIDTNGNKIDTGYWIFDTGNKNERVGDWVKVGEKEFEQGRQELVLPFSGVSENLVTENLGIKNYSPNFLYQLTVDFQASESGKISVKENQDKEIAKENFSPTGDKFKHLELLFRSSSEATAAAVLFADPKGESINLPYKNLEVKQIYQPEVMLRNTVETNRNMSRRDVGTKYAASPRNKEIPKITFVKINPTKYRVKIEGAVDPYTLVFSESFHQGWKAYIANNQSLITNHQYGEIVASYFNGDIKEGTHKNIFLDKNTFETWGKKPIAEDRHYLVNGYANSWYITPEDVGGKENYELIVEFWPQRLFYIGLFISGITLIGCLGYLGWGKLRNWEIEKLRN